MPDLNQRQSTAKVPNNLELFLALLNKKSRIHQIFDRISARHRAELAKIAERLLSIDAEQNNIEAQCRDIERKQEMVEHGRELIDKKMPKVDWLLSVIGSDTKLVQHVALDRLDKRSIFNFNSLKTFMESNKEHALDPRSYDSTDSFTLIATIDSALYLAAKTLEFGMNCINEVNTLTPIAHYNLFEKYNTWISNLYDKPQNLNKSCTEATTILHTMYNMVKKSCHLLDNPDELHDFTFPRYLSSPLNTYGDVYDIVLDLEKRLPILCDKCHQLSKELIDTGLLGATENAQATSEYLRDKYSQLYTEYKDIAKKADEKQAEYKTREKKKSHALNEVDNQLEKIPIKYNDYNLTDYFVKLSYKDINRSIELIEDILYDDVSEDFNAMVNEMIADRQKKIPTKKNKVKTRPINRMLAEAKSKVENANADESNPSEFDDMLIDNVDEFLLQHGNAEKLSTLKEYFDDKKLARIAKCIASYESGKLKAPKLYCSNEYKIGVNFHNFVGQNMRITLNREIDDGKTTFKIGRIEPRSEVYSRKSTRAYR
ncbi:MAG: hypothetical protein LBM38_00765 [Clostridiales bacterium]|nr:hypothetical protein [Clostridiales bacterium]